MKLTKETIKKIANKGYLEFIEKDNEKEIKNSLYDMVTRYGRKTEQGGYSANEIVDFLYIYFYEIYCKFRNLYTDGIKDLIEERDKLKKQLKR